MSLSHGIGSLSRRKPFLLPSPGEQHVFSQQSRFLLPSNEHPFTQRKRHRRPLLPTPIHPPFAQQWRTFLPPFHVIQPFIQHNKNRIHLWRNRINNYPSPNYSWRHPSMRNTGSQFAKRKCLLSPFKKQFTGHQNFSNIRSHTIIPIDFVRGWDESDTIQDEMDTYSQSDKLVKLGEWEKHTKGIGAKLLLKMGFQPGKGLGKSLQGRTQPVEAMAPNGGGAIGSDKQVLLLPAQQSAEYNCQASNDLRSPSLIAATLTPQVICISSSDEDDYLIVHDDECLPEAPSPVCHTSFEANVMQTREKRLSELPWTCETLCSTSSYSATIANSPFAVKPYSATSTESPDIVYISSSDEGECVVLYDSPRQR